MKILKFLFRMLLSPLFLVVWIIIAFVSVSYIFVVWIMTSSSKDDKEWMEEEKETVNVVIKDSIVHWFTKF